MIGFLLALFMAISTSMATSKENSIIMAKSNSFAKKLNHKSIYSFGISTSSGKVYKGPKVESLKNSNLKKFKGNIDKNRKSRKNAKMRTMNKGLENDQVCRIKEVKIDWEPLKSDFILKDGNCFYRAVSYQIYGNQNLHYKIRKNAMQVIKNHKERFNYLLGDFIPDESGQRALKKTLNEPANYTGVDLFTKIHSISGVFAENEDIIGTAVALGCKIRIYYADLGLCYIYTPYNLKESNTIDLYLKRNHYEVWLKNNSQRMDINRSKSEKSKSNSKVSDNMIIKNIRQIISAFLIFLLLKRNTTLPK